MKAYPPDRDDSAFTDAEDTIKAALMRGDDVRVSDGRVLTQVDVEEMACIRAITTDCAADVLATRWAESFIELCRQEAA